MHNDFHNFSLKNSVKLNHLGISGEESKKVSQSVSYERFYGYGRGKGKGGGYDNRAGHEIISEKLMGDTKIF